MQPLVFPLLAGSVVAAVLVLIWRKKPSAPYPPGPPPKLFIENALDIPSEKQWVKYLEWSKRLNSDIIHMSAMGNHIVVLQKMEDITELLERRSAIYSSRPCVPSVGLFGVDKVSAFLPYNGELRRHRSIFHEFLRKELLPDYHHIYLDKVHSMIDRLLSDPEGFRSHCKWLGIAITMSITFGYDVAVGDMDDQYVALAEQVIIDLTRTLQAGATLIDVIPILRYIPPWIPGASTQRLAAKAKETWIAYKTGPFQIVKSNFLAGTPKDCILTELLRRRLKDDGATIEGEDDLKEAMATVYLAGAETMQVSQIYFIMAMALYPSAQKRIQDEIDRVVGMDRLPTFEDRTSLPHVEAALRETLRWRPAAPLAMPHSTTKDDIYKGFYIPKGTIVFPNSWAISRDEGIYPNPDTFDPERFFNTDGFLNDDTVGYAFGYGRRICVGNLLARDVLWITMASLLSTCSISKAKDENGVDIDIDSHAVTSGITSSAQPFKCTIVPRSPRAAELIRTAAMAAKRDMRTG